MNRTYNNDNDLQDLLETEGRDREISLGTATILGIFFVLALLCAVFFGFGYSMGRRSAQSVMTASGTGGTTEEGGSKPASGSAAGRASAAHPEDESAADASVSDSSDAPAPVKGGKSASVVVPMKPAASNGASGSDARAAQPANPAVKVVSLGRPTAAPPMPATVAVSGVGTAVVQVAAVSHQEDANVLVNALKKRGYNVTIRQQPQDKLLHVQIGPFASKKDADAMKQRLLADGYNAIVK